MAAKGAGFTNVEIDLDGTRRRIDLAQNIHDHWYLQLAFAPLVNYLGSPEIELDNRKLVMRNAKMPEGTAKDITVPLDGKGRMVLDWPKTDYVNSYTHISFHEFSLLEDIEAELAYYGAATNTFDLYAYPQYDISLFRVISIANDLEELFKAIQYFKNEALDNCSEEDFNACLELRLESRELMRELIDLDPKAKLIALLDIVPERAEIILNEAEYIGSIMDKLVINLPRYEEVSSVIENKVKDKFCILGRVDTGTTDYGANPFYGKYINVGTHGVVLDMILSESFINPLNRIFIILFTVIFVPLFFLISAKFSPIIRAVSGFIITLVIIFGAAMLFRLTGYFANPLLAIFAMLSAVIVREIIAYAGSEREKQFIRKAFSTYVSDDVVKEIISDPTRLQLGGTKRHMSAIFTDVQGFSTISEQLDPEDLVSLLNKYLSAMSDVILSEQGTIDKYEGDAIIAFFGAPLPLEDHALRACVSAINMKKVEAELNKTIMEYKLSPVPLFTRIGINTNYMVAGNMGTASKMNYTIMGSAVNLAARLEGVNKQYGTWILASEDTVRETGETLLHRKLDRVRVVGINEPVRLCELIDLADIASRQDKKLVSVFHEALDNFEKHNWKQALDGFTEAASIKTDDAPSIMYIDRCNHFMKSPPKDSWDGVYNLTSK